MIAMSNNSLEWSYLNNILFFQGWLPFICSSKPKQGISPRKYCPETERNEHEIFWFSNNSADAPITNEFETEIGKCIN